MRYEAYLITTSHNISLVHCYLAILKIKSMSGLRIMSQRISTKILSQINNNGALIKLSHKLRMNEIIFCAICIAPSDSRNLFMLSPKKTRIRMITITMTMNRKNPPWLFFNDCCIEFNTFLSIYHISTNTKVD